MSNFFHTSSMKVTRLALLLAVIALCTTAFTSDTVKSVGKRAQTFVLEDQFEKRWSWQTHWKGKPVVLVMSDWQGSDYLTKWTEPLSAHFADRVQFVACADVSLAPAFLRSFLRNKFRDAYRHSVLLDWDGNLFDHYHTQAGLPNVIFIDPTETVRLHTWGVGKVEHVQSFTVQLERLLSEQ